jgi:hypothetical protein
VRAAFTTNGWSLEIGRLFSTSPQQGPFAAAAQTETGWSWMSLCDAWLGLAAPAACSPAVSWNCILVLAL